MNNKTTKAWRQYEAGCDYKRSIGLYETVRENERFLRGDQWNSNEGGELPKPVFNILRRVIDYMVCTVFSKKVAINFTDDDLPYIDDAEKLGAMRQGIDVLGRHASYRWERNKMDRVMRRALYDAAISGDGAVYCYFDPEVHSPGPFKGDIVTENIDNVNIFVADVNKADIQSQEYIILAGRQSVLSLRREAVKYGMKHGDADRLICADESHFGAGDLASKELDGDEDEKKATYLIKFWRENGKVCFEKSLKSCVIRRVKTNCCLYPVAYMNWYYTKNSFHGTSPITGLLPNQKFINRGYAMAMKHMMDTAFSKVIYDKTRIPEWTNDVGEAIAAIGSTNVSDAVSIIEPGKLEEGYMDLLRDSISATKEMMGATEAALGNLNPTNTSAILAIQEASKVPLLQIKDNVSGFAEDIANIWADMMCCYYPPERLIPFYEDGEIVSGCADLGLLRDTMIQAHVEISDPERFSIAYNQVVLDRLLEGGHITLTEYLERLPAGIFIERDALIAKRKLAEINTEEDKNGRNKNAA